MHRNSQPIHRRYLCIFHKIFHPVMSFTCHFLHPDEGKWTRDEIERQMNFIRSQKMAGEGHYRVKYLMENTQGIYDELAENFLAFQGRIGA